MIDSYIHLLFPSICTIYRLYSLLVIVINAFDVGSPLMCLFIVILDLTYQLFSSLFTSCYGIPFIHTLSGLIWYFTASSALVISLHKFYPPFPPVLSVFYLIYDYYAFRSSYYSYDCYIVWYHCRYDFYIMNFFYAKHKLLSFVYV